MPASPLSHHEILALVEPFARRGRHVDLGASDRLARRLAFKPVDHPGDVPGVPGLRETLQLESFDSGNVCLTRTLTRAGGPQVRLQANGTQPGDLLAQIEAVAPQRHFSAGPGFVVARSYLVASGPSSSSDGQDLVLTDAVVQVDGLKLALTLSSVRGVSAELALQATGAHALALPEDLLAVLGWDWARLIREKGGWKSKLRLRGSALKRSRKAEAALDRAAAHLAQTLSEAPARYHERWVAARWGVVFRRAIPSLTAISLIAAVAIVPRVAQVENPGRWLLLFHLPTALLALSFCLQELPQFEVPPLPRRSRAANWHQADHAAQPPPSDPARAEDAAAG